jgi:hypothetical protein
LLQAVAVTTGMSNYDKNAEFLVLRKYLSAEQRFFNAGRKIDQPVLLIAKNRSVNTANN